VSTVEVRPGRRVGVEVSSGAVGPPGLAGPPGPPGESGGFTVPRGSFGHQTNPDQLPETGFIPVDFDGPGRPAAGFQLAVGESMQYTLNGFLYVFVGPAALPGGWYNAGQARGPTGPIGETGPPGEEGRQGPPGQQGPIGNPGPTGAQGSPGPQGAQGERGLDGTPGATGPPGPPGTPGADPDVDKAYVDAQDGLRLQLSGGAMTGPIFLGPGFTPTIDDMAAPKSYVDQRVDLRVAKSGDTMTGQLLLPPLGGGTQAASAMPKQYIDEQDLFLYSQVAENLVTPLRTELLGIIAALTTRVAALEALVRPIQVYERVADIVVPLGGNEVALAQLTLPAGVHLMSAVASFKLLSVNAPYQVDVRFTSNPTGPFSGARAAQLTLHPAIGPQSVALGPTQFTLPAGGATVYLMASTRSVQSGGGGGDVVTCVESTTEFNRPGATAIIAA
jgi:Collagen triple helix repeat (20 copies)